MPMFAFPVGFFVAHRSNFVWVERVLFKVPILQVFGVLLCKDSFLTHRQILLTSRLSMRDSHHSCSFLIFEHPILYLDIKHLILNCLVLYFAQTFHQVLLFEGFHCISQGTHTFLELSYISKQLLPNID